VLVPIVASALLPLWPALATSENARPAAAGLVAPATVCAHASSANEPPELQLRAMACLVNYARRTRGLRQLPLVTALNRAGSWKLADDVRCGEFSHTPCGRPWVLGFVKSGYLRGTRSYAVAENLAWGEASFGSPRQILTAWLSSPEHCRNLLDPSWRQMGLALAKPRSFRGQTEVTLWANEFGTRR
jgi:uncharacterized protein YkwD